MRNAVNGSMTSSLRTMLEQRRSSYGQAMVLLNTTSHDEDHYADPWEALLRTAVCGTSDGVPMVCYGQELGMSTLYGVDLWERNLGKFIPHFKTWNSLMPLWGNTDYGLDQLYPVYAGIGAARQASPALRASARYFLNLKTGGVQERLFSVAKFTSRNTAPNFADIVFAFANLDRNADQSGNFNVSVDADGNGTNDFGIRRGRSYRLRNLAAHEGITSGRRLLPYATASGDALLDNGLPVTARKVPVTNAAWSSAPYEALYLKLEDVSTPPAPAVPYAAQPYVIGDNISAAWTAVVDAEAGISGYTVTLTGAAVPAPQSQTTAGTSNTFPAGSSYADGAEVGISVRSLSLTGIASAASPVLTLSRLHPETDFDQDGIPNLDEDIMGTDPLNAGSVFRLLSQERAADGTVSLTLATVAGRSYTLRSSTDLVVWVDEGPAVPGTGASISLTDTLPGEARKFYTIAISR